MRKPILLAPLTLVALTATACTSATADTSSTDTSGSGTPSTTITCGTSLDEIAAAAKDEGQVNLIALPDTWANYEGIQADIFDHILAVLPQFGLRVFQNPTGADWRKL